MHQVWPFDPGPSRYKFGQVSSIWGASDSSPLLPTQYGWSQSHNCPYFLDFGFMVAPLVTMHCLYSRDPSLVGVAQSVTSSWLGVICSRGKLGVVLGVLVHAV